MKNVTKFIRRSDDVIVWKILCKGLISQKPGLLFKENTLIKWKTHLLTIVFHRNFEKLAKKGPGVYTSKIKIRDEKLGRNTDSNLLFDRKNILGIQEELSI